MNIITVKEGQLGGKIQETRSGFKYQSFQGIPYAKPPLGPLRFKDPQKVQNWIGVKAVTAEGNMCPQLDRQTGEIIGDEDCLFLNVYTPRERVTSPLAVMVWIHGGGFFKGSGNSEAYGPDYLIEKNVICVTINYRFGIFGFLCLHSQDVPGNAGLKDQILALRWIKENIEAFGGDPNNITVFGESAGAASISFLTLSPAAQGLFHKVIIQSGTSLCSWSTQGDPLTYASKIAEKLNISSHEKKDVLKFLQNVDFKTLTQHASNILSAEDMSKYLPIAFLPVVEKSFPGVESVLIEPPEEIFRLGKFVPMPTIAGYSSKEGLLMFEKIGHDLSKLQLLVENIKYFLPPKVLLETELTDSCVKLLNKSYFNSKPIDSAQINNVIDLLSDFLFRHPINWNINLLTKYSSAPIYYFQFSYQGNLSRDKKIFQDLKLDGASHSEECGYIFRKQYLDEEKVLPEDILTRQRLVGMWTNFAKTGNPTPETNEVITVLWKPVEKNILNYLEIGKELRLGLEPNAESLQLWMKIQDGGI